MWTTMDIARLSSVIYAFIYKGERNTSPRKNVSWHFCFVELLELYGWVIGMCMVEKSVLMLMDERIIAHRRS